MQFVGDGIGHKSTDYIQQDIPICIDDNVADVYNEVIMPYNTQGHTQAEGTIDTDED